MGSKPIYLAQLPITGYQPLSELQRRLDCFAQTQLLDQAFFKLKRDYASVQKQDLASIAAVFLHLQAQASAQ